MIILAVDNILGCASLKTLSLLAGRYHYQLIGSKRFLITLS